MSQPTELPIPPDLAARYRGTPEGRTWLASLPGIAESLLARWRLASGLRPGVVPWNGHGAVVIPVVREDGSPAALKIAFPPRRSQGGAARAGTVEREGRGCAGSLGCCHLFHAPRKARRRAPAQQRADD